MSKKKFLEVSPKVRLLKYNPIVGDTTYILELRSWFGFWYRPNRFYTDLKEAMVWFEYYKSGKKIIYEVIAIHY